MADIVHPHGLHLADAPPKLRGLALYAETHVSAYRRIESGAQALGWLRAFDLTNARLRLVIAGAAGVTDLFAGTLAADC